MTLPDAIAWAFGPASCGVGMFFLVKAARNFFRPMTTTMPSCPVCGMPRDGSHPEKHAHCAELLQKRFEAKTSKIEKGISK